jgi:streptogramin lyase
VDAWAVTGEGSVLYGGTSDGYLFRFEPKQMRTQNLGKPLNQYRIRGLVVARNGKLYGVGGDEDEMARLFSYNPANGAYELLGMVDVNRRPYYAWQAYVIDSAALGLEGTVYLGQSERKSKLYLYYPEP